MSVYVVRAYQPPDGDEWLRMRLALWPEDPQVCREEMQAWLARPDTAVLVAERPSAAGNPSNPDNPGALAGFAEIGLRPYADGCETSPVAFLEGWYVDPGLRHQGIGAALVHAAEAWARARGLHEFASDALLDNIASHLAHEALGFIEIERAVRYRKLL